MKYSNVRKEHLFTAELVVDSVDLDILSEYYSLSDELEFTQVCAMLKEIAQKEVSHYFTRHNQSSAWAISEWLRGLPSVVTIPFTYYDIEILLRKNGTIQDNDNEVKIEKALDNYWYHVGFIIDRHAVKNTKQLYKA